jgi:hypothetical protein
MHRGSCVQHSMHALHATSVTNAANYLLVPDELNASRKFAERAFDGGGLLLHSVRVGLDALAEINDQLVEIVRAVLQCLQPPVEALTDTARRIECSWIRKHWPHVRRCRKRSLVGMLQDGLQSIGKARYNRLDDLLRLSSLLAAQTLAHGLQAGPIRRCTLGFFNI